MVPKIKEVEFSQDININTGSNAVLIYNPPFGYIERVLNILLTVYPPSGGSSGNYTVYFGILRSTQTYGSIYPHGGRFVSAYNVTFVFRDFYLESSVSSRYPSSDADLMNALRSTWMGYGVREIYSDLSGNPNSQTPAKYSFHIWIVNNTNKSGAFSVYLDMLLESNRLR